MYLKAGPFLCLRGRVALPLTGTWVADLAVDPGTSDATLPDFGAPIAIGLGENGFTLQGTVRRINTAFDTVFARVVGGGGGLYKPVGPKAYQGATFGLIVNDLLGSVGESLSTTVSADIRQISLPFWTVPKSPMFEALANLVIVARVTTATDVNWRVLPDGTIFIGVEQWPQTGMASFDLMSWQPEQLKTTIYTPDPQITPGQIWQSGNVSNVEHVVEPAEIRSKVWFLNAQ